MDNITRSSLGMASDLPEGCAIYGRHLQRPENSASLDDLSEGSAKIIFILQMTICLTGILGNSLSLVVILRDRKLKTVPNVYITHLAVVDLISCMLIPVSIGQHFTHGIPEVACKIIGYVIAMNMAASLFSMMLIAINRYILIVKGRYRYNKLYTKRNVTISLLLTWLWVAVVIVVLSEAGLGFFGYNEKMGTCFIISYCFTNYIYVCCIISSTIFLPTLIVIGITYTKIILKLKEVGGQLAKHETKGYFPSNGTKPLDVEQDTSSHVGLSDGNSMEQSSASRPLSYASVKGRIFGNAHQENKTYKKQKPQLKKQKYAILNIVIIYTVLVMCWAPIMIQFFVDMNGKLPAFVYHTEFIFVYLNSAFNVLIYGFMNRAHRQAYKKLFTRCFCSTK